MASKIENVKTHLHVYQRQPKNDCLVLFKVATIVTKAEKVLLSRIMAHVKVLEFDLKSWQGWAEFFTGCWRVSKTSLNYHYHLQSFHLGVSSTFHVWAKITSSKLLLLISNARKLIYLYQSLVFLPQNLGQAARNCMTWTCKYLLSSLNRFVHVSFMEMQTASVFKLPYSFFRAEGNKSYPLKLGSDVLLVYCHMTDDLGACGSGGWTLVMKMDDYQVNNNIKWLYTRTCKPLRSA